MKPLNDSNKVDDVYLSPYDRWLTESGMTRSTEALNNKKTEKRGPDGKT